MDVLVPAKNTRASKSRLAIVLSPRERVALALAMLKDVLTALSGVRCIRDVHVITDDPVIADIGKNFGAHILQDDHMGDLNAALHQARRHLKRCGVSECAVLAADLPLVSRDDLERLFDKHVQTPAATIAPAYDDGGTNALVMSPLDLLEFEFGPSSFERHCAQARRKECEPEIVRTAGLELDIDWPRDLNRLISITRGSSTASLIADLAHPLTRRQRKFERAS